MAKKKEKKTKARKNILLSATRTTNNYYRVTTTTTPTTMVTTIPANDEWIEWRRRDKLRSSIYSKSENRRVNCINKNSNSTKVQHCRRANYPIYRTKYVSSRVRNLIDAAPPRLLYYSSPFTNWIYLKIDQIKGREKTASRISHEIYGPTAHASISIVV